MEQIEIKKNTNTVYTLRIDTQLFECVKQSAKMNKRSIAKEIEFGVEQYLKNQK